MLFLSLESDARACSANSRAALRGRIALGRRQPRQPDATLRFECFYPVEMFERDINVIDAVDQTILASGLMSKSCCVPSGAISL
jgi:hypothetical protein